MNIFNQREYACHLHLVRVHLVLWMCVCLFYLLNTGHFFWLMHTCISFEYVTSCENTFPDSSLPGPEHGRFILSYCGLNWERKTTNLWARHLTFLIPCWVPSQKKNNTLYLISETVKSGFGAETPGYMGMADVFRCTTFTPSRLGTVSWEKLEHKTTFVHLLPKDIVPTNWIYIL